MNGKRGRIILVGAAFRAWTRRVFTRDGWRCRRCDSKEHLQCHHLIKRSDLRLDIMSNGCTLCARCHQLVEDSKIDIIGLDANEILRFRVHTDTV